MRDKQLQINRLAFFLCSKTCVILFFLSDLQLEAAESRFAEGRKVFSFVPFRGQNKKSALFPPSWALFPSDRPLRDIHRAAKMCLPACLHLEIQSNRPFHDLRLTPQDCQNISMLIKSMADLDFWTLLKKAKKIKKLGKQIEPVHPLRFLGWIFSNDELKRRIPKIKKSYFKWKEFIRGLFARLEIEASRGNMIPFIPGFAELVGCSQVVIEEKIINSDWAGMLHELMR